MASDPKAVGPNPERPAAMVGAPIEVEVSRSWLSPNKRLRLVEVIEKRSRRLTLESQVVWESVQGRDHKLDPSALEEAIREAHEDLRRLERSRKAGLAGEWPLPPADRFHYYPRKDILLLTLEMLKVQRKEALWEMRRRNRRTQSQHAPAARKASFETPKANGREKEGKADDTDSVQITMA